MPLIKIDCEEKGENDEPINTKLCAYFKLTGYPSIMYVNTKGYEHGDDISEYAELLEFHKYNSYDIHKWMEEKVDDDSQNAAHRISIGKARAANAKEL